MLRRGVLLVEKGVLQKGGFAWAERVAGGVKKLVRGFYCASRFMMRRWPLKA